MILRDRVRVGWSIGKKESGLTHPEMDLVMTRSSGDALITQDSRYAVERRKAVAIDRILPDPGRPVKEFVDPEHIPTGTYVGRTLIAPVGV